MSLVGRYAHWLHTRWPAGSVEPLPERRGDGSTAVSGVRIVGDLTGVPLLKFSADSGARAVAAIRAEPDFTARSGDTDVVDVAIVGGGVAGIAAAIEAKGAGLSFVVFEASETFSTVANFPKGKPIYTYPTGMTPAGKLQFRSEVHPKEQLLADLHTQRREAGVETVAARIERIERRGPVLLLHHGDGRTVTRARRAIVAIGRSGNHRRLGVPGEDSGKVFNRLHDPKDFAGQDVLVVGGGDSALEIAIAVAAAGGHVTISYRKPDFARPKPENVEMIERLRLDASAPGSVTLALATQVVRIEPKAVILRDGKGTESAIANDVVFTMIGREAPLDFFRRSGIPIRGEWTPARAAALAAFFLFCVFLYNWKSGGALTQAFERRGLFPFRVPEALARARASAARPATALGTLAISMREPSFYYSLAYCLCVVLFGIRRIRRRPTPYVRRQTAVLAAVQVIPLFLLPYFLLPWLGHNGVFDSGFGRSFADHLFPAASGGHGREYWRAFGFVLAWPLFVWNVFSSRPMWWWLAIAFVQTFVLIPLAIRRWGKGVYCGWICSCGALAETMGDDHRQKMPHGPAWNRVNMLGQGILAAAFFLLLTRIASWSAPDSRIGRGAQKLYDGLLSGWHAGIVPLNYYHLVDIFLAGIVGVGLYFWFSGRVWCRFACPLAALMHVYARFSKFRIFAEKSKCISCNVCTSVCHQGIDIMSFANKGAPMEDPECVRCSACVQMCPTGVLSFGRIGAGGLPVLDRLPASPVKMAERAAASGKISIREEHACDSSPAVTSTA
jgi:NosR/NirI family nitrous oxide reductase transcriptional regulator